MINFRLQNKSSDPGLSFQLAGYSTALRQQIEQFEQAWQIAGSVTVEGNPMPTGMQVAVQIIDSADVQGALGYHDIDTNGVPYIKVFVTDSKKAGVSLSSVISHEILEVLGDPFVDSSVVVEDGKGGATIYMAEVCDPVEGDSYIVNGVEVSNFVLPAWFGAPGKRFDHSGKLAAPLTMTSGGYFSYLQVTEQGSGWQQKMGDKARPWGGAKK